MCCLTLWDRGSSPILWRVQPDLHIFLKTIILHSLIKLPLFILPVIFCLLYTRVLSLSLSSNLLSLPNTNNNDCTHQLDSSLTLNMLLVKPMIWTLCYVAMWYMFSLGITFYNKWLFHTYDFEFPLTVTVVHMCLIFLFASLVRYLRYSCWSCERPVVSWYVLVTRIFPAGMVGAFDIGLSNLSLMMIDITLYTMCKSTVLAFTLIFACIFKLERLVSVLLCKGMGKCRSNCIHTYTNTHAHSLSLSLIYLSVFLSIYLSIYLFIFLFLLLSVFPFCCLISSCNLVFLWLFPFPLYIYLVAFLFNP